jgi:hypothetical protein
MSQRIVSTIGNMKMVSSIETSEEWSMMYARSIEEIESIRPIWERMQRNESQPIPNADIDRYITIIKASGGDVRPYVMIAEHDGQPAVVVVSRLERRPVELKLGYKILLRPKLRCLTVVYGGILGQPGNELCFLVINALKKELRHDGIDMVYFHHLRTDSDMYEFVRGMPGVLTRGYLPRMEKHWEISIPGKMDDFYQRFSGKRRSELKRYIRKLERAHSVQVTSCHQEDDLDHAIKQMEEISKKTYQSGMGAGFVDNELTRNLLHLAATKNWLKVHILFVDDNPTAFQVGFKYGNTYFADQIGYDPAWKHFRVGTVLLLKVIEELCVDPSVNKFDFGFGDADYKQLFCDKSWMDVSIYFFAPRVYPVFINMLRSSTEALDWCLKCIVNKYGRVDRVKRWWRDRLQAKK